MGGWPRQVIHSISRASAATLHTGTFEGSLPLAEISRGIKKVRYYWRGDPTHGNRGDKREEDGFWHFRVRKEGEHKGKKCKGEVRIGQLFTRCYGRDVQKGCCNGETNYRKIPKRIN
jgi:hypothetical protein